MRESKVEEKIVRKSKGLFLGFNTGFIVYLSLDSGKHLVSPSLYSLVLVSVLLWGER